MLRLKPSELTLTPDDVEETLQRMARRQPPPPVLGQRRNRASGRLLAPRVMPGAQRLTRHTITDLGNIPILRPQPQQAIIAHVDDESDESGETLAEPARRIESSPESVSAYPAQLTSTSFTATAPPGRHSTRLPFRLPRPRRRQQSGQSEVSSPKEQSCDSEGTLIETGVHPEETINAADLATPGWKGRNSRSTTDSSPTRQPGPSETPAALRGGASRSQRARIRSVGQDTPHAPSPLRHTQLLSPTHQSEGESTDSDEEHPVIHLQGYFDYKRDPNVEYTYNFRELYPQAPRTEPVRRMGQPRFHTRSQSSNDAPPLRRFPSTLSAQIASEGEDVFWTDHAPATEHSNPERAGERPRLRSSEMSNTSFAYSYYELPDNRQSSGEQSAQGPLTQSQLDGTVASRQASCGTYRSIRLSEVPGLDDNVLRPPNPNALTFVSAFPGQFSVSPSPAEPYARPGSSDSYVGQAVRRAIENSSGREPHSDAIVAALENRDSPLNALRSQYEWASQRLVDQQGQSQRTSQHGGQASVYPSTGLGINTHGPRQSTRGPLSGTFSPFPGALSAPSGTHTLAPGTYGPPMVMADDPYTRGVSAHASRSHGYTTRPVSTQPAPTTNHVVPPHPRSTRGGRSGQRSSENAPVGFSVQPGHTSRIAQVQSQVTAFEQMHNAVQPMQARLRPEVLQASPVQRDNEPLSNPMPAAQARVPPHHISRQYAALSPGQGNAGRRPVRMDPRLQNQENSGEAELEMMRQELEAVRMRHDEDQQGYVMDETPPRIGRVERHM